VYGKEHSMLEEKLAKLLNMSIEQVYDIDEEMRPIIYTLNSKGYTTLGCCQGHTERVLEKSPVFVIITFRDTCKFSIEPPRIPKSRTKKYGGIDYPRPYSCPHNIGVCYVTRKNGTYEQKEQERKEFMQIITDWANELPDLNKG
jgi:hypothetical protein